MHRRSEIFTYALSEVLDACIVHLTGEAGRSHQVDLLVEVERLEVLHRQVGRADHLRLGGRT